MNNIAKELIAEMCESVQNHLRAGETEFANELDDYIEALKAAQPESVKPAVYGIDAVVADARNKMTYYAAESAAPGAVDALPAKWRSDARRYGNEDEAAVANSCADELTAALAQQPDGPRSGVDCSRESCRLDGRLPCASESCPQRDPDGPRAGGEES